MGVGWGGYKKPTRTILKLEKYSSVKKFLSTKGVKIVFHFFSLFFVNWVISGKKNFEKFSKCQNGTQLKVTGTQLKVTGTHLKVTGTQLKVTGTQLKVTGTQ